MKYFVFASLLAVGVFASNCHPQYECCAGCDVVYTDEEGLWGVENNEWCFINNSKCGGNNAAEYQNCVGCDVQYTDASGNWGIENGNWCKILSTCGNVQNGQNVQNAQGQNDNIIDTTDGSMPIITLISSSGNSDFATKPVEKHIAQQSSMGREMPPEPWYEECTISVTDASGANLINGVKGKVKVRGNWTSNYVKKSLRINFEETQNMVGLHGGEKYKNWVLLAEFKDGSMLRNKSALALSRGILEPDGLYASDSQLVELKINDEYFGVYLLAELQQINNGRVDITKGKEDYQGTDIGYFLELDNGYSMYEDKIQTLVIDYNNNAPLKPFDGQGGSSKTIEPNSSGFGGGFGGFNMGNWGGFGGNNQQNNQQQNTQQQQNNNQQNNQFNNWGGNQQQNNQQQQNNNQQNNNQQNNNQQNNGWGNMGNWNFGGNNGQTNQNNNGQNNGFGGFNFGGMFKRQFNTGSGENMTIKSDVYSQQQNEFIGKFINGAYKIMYEAAYNKNPLKFNSDYSEVVEAPELTPRQAIENVVDADSLADLYIISEMTCDADLYYSSFYMDVDFGSGGSKKLRFEAPWDFDSALGNKDRCADGKGYFAANITPDNGGMGNKINPWLAVIMYEDWYQDIIKSKWTKAYDSGVFSKVVDMIHSDTVNFQDAFKRNYEKWDNINQNHSFANELSPGAKQCKTQSEAAEYLAKWFESRVAFVNSCWHS